MTIQVEEPVNLTHTFKLWDNSTIRLDPNDGDVLNVPKSFDFETDEHGFGPGNIVVPRPDNWDPFDSAALSELVTTDREGRNVYEARLSARPRTGVNEVTLQLEGWSKHADDDETAKMIFRDMDLSHWQSMSSTRKIAQMGAGWNVTDPSLETDSLGLQSQMAKLNDQWSGGYLPLAESWYVAPASQIISSVYLDFTTNLYGALFSANDDSGNGAVTIAAPLGSFAGTYSVNKRCVATQVYFTVAGGASGFVYYGANRFGIIYGNHGLTKRGSEPTTTNPRQQAGFYVSDMAAYIIGRWCQKFNITPDSIEPTSFIVPHAVYTDTGMTAGKMLDNLIVFGGNSLYPLEWFVYDGRRFNLKSPGTYGNTYRVRRSEGGDSLDQGPDVSLMMNGIQGTYNPGDGTSKTVGPLNSGSDLETALLRWDDPNHPANRAGYPVWRHLDCGVMNANAAILLCQLAMTARNNQQWRGSINQRGMVRDASGNVHPPYMIRAHESAIVEDDPDLRTRWITGTKYDDKTRTTEVQIGQRPDRIDDVLARAGVAITGIGAT